MKKKTIKEPVVPSDKNSFNLLRVVFWFFLGGVLGLFFFCSFLFIYYKQTYANRVYPGVYIDGVSFEGQTTDEVREYFAKKNTRIADTVVTMTYADKSATTSASALQLGYNENLLADQAVGIGKSPNILSNLSMLLQTYLSGTNLPPSFSVNDTALKTLLAPFITEINVAPVDALFTIENGKVTAFQPSSEGKAVNTQSLQTTLFIKTEQLLKTNRPQKQISLLIPFIVTKPEITTDEANTMGVSELIGVGVSTFEHSISNRIYNINLAASKFNGILIPPQETFSFNKVLGDVSKFTGFKEAYVIQNGRTVVGDGGGVCQVSTTFFRALLEAGMPIVERHQHAYRVGYYEQNSLPGIDAAIFTPNIDLRFKNDTGHHILVQTYFDAENATLTFYLYGTKDGREVTMTKPVITSQSPAPEPLYQDDPTLPKGEVKQVDFAAAGAKVFFTRTVKKNNIVIINDTFASNYRPWQAVYLRGTKEN